MLRISRYSFTILTGLIFVTGILFLLHGRTYTSLLSANKQTAHGADVMPEDIFRPPQKTGEVHSPDGTMKLFERVVWGAGGLATKEYVTSAIGGAREHVILSIPPSDTRTVTIPPNSWSPDNAYVFLAVTSGSGTQYPVYAADGSPPGGAPEAVEVASLFARKFPDLAVRDVTGWDDPVLLHIFTVSGEGRGPSFWFDVPGRSFIRLASY